jgi:hypothetical protein
MRRATGAPPSEAKAVKNDADKDVDGIGNALNSKVLLSLGPLQVTRYEAFKMSIKVIVALVVYFVILRPKDEGSMSESKHGF